MHKIILLILLNVQADTHCMMQKVKNFICCAEHKNYSALEKKGDYSLALLLAVEKNNIKRVKKYITQYTFDKKIIEIAFHRILNKGSSCDSIIVKLLLTKYKGDFILQDCLWPTHSMLYYACHNTNIETIVALIDADASPFKSLPNEFPVVDLIELNLGRDDVNDPRIRQAIARFRERYYEKLKKEENKRSEIRAFVANCLNVGGDFNPGDIVDEYLFEKEGTKSLRWHDEEIAHDSLDVDEPTTVHLHLEK